MRTIRGFSLCLHKYKCLIPANMTDSLSQKVIFIDSIKDYDVTTLPDCAMHILCTCGSMDFDFQGSHYHIVAGDYVILPCLMFLSEVTESVDFQALTMGVSTTFVSTLDYRSNYGATGQLLLMHNPVMHLSHHDYTICLEDLQRIRARLEETEHHFREEMMGHLLMVHILNLHDIHVRCNMSAQLSERLSSLLHGFIGLLYEGEYRQYRDLAHYASRLCITPHYLSEICRKASGYPATYWIDRFTLQEIHRLLCQNELTLSDIASELHFSSVTYFGRYVKKHLGVSPSEYRNMLFKNHQ